MVNFIMQEAHEKVNEIRIKTDHDFNLEKQQLVHNGKLKVQEEYTQKEKDLEVEQRVARSAAVGASRMKKMKARDDMLEELKKSSLERLGRECVGPKYTQYLKNLIIQGLIKIEESTVEIQTRAEDKDAVAGVLSEAVAEYKAKMTAAGHTVDPKVKISNHVLPSKSIGGGIILSALDNRIVLNQTVDERLQITYMDILPSVRYGLFPERP